MSYTLSGPVETIVCSTHGNAGFSDTDNPVTINHHTQGAVITPPQPETTSINLSQDSKSEQTEPATVVVGKVHYALPTLRTPDEESSLGSLVDGIVSTALDISVAPYSSEWHRDKNESCEQEGGNLEAKKTSKIMAVDVYAGRELLWSSNRLPDGQHVELPTDQDVRLHMVSVIWPDDKMHFNENVRGLGVTLTAEFYGQSPALMISSIALVQDLQRQR
ncbi:MAG: hypothetical protein GOMPHAMPRED_004758 [Gomphillus americanus]|uniref:Uncharacterized protein n=1 Tax=Gomphillus americanus TaxID=1940652 RepID=A0A8H3EL62_9LECA|nr:MAG: hypothetical protein GOMPHAMPRED_004758 [Gomphillus americanus]